MQTKEPVLKFSTVVLCLLGIGFFMSGPVADLLDYYEQRLFIDMSKIEHLKHLDEPQINLE